MRRKNRKVLIFPANPPGHPHLRFRGTTLAICAVTMKNETDSMTDVGGTVEKSYNGLGGGSGGPFDAQLLHPAAERAGVHVQNFRRAAFAFDHPIGLIQHRLDMPALQVVERTIVGSRSSRGNEALSISDFRMSLLTSAATF